MALGPISSPQSPTNPHHLQTSSSSPLPRIGIFLSASRFSPAAIETAHSSQIPLLLIQCSTPPQSPSSAKTTPSHSDTESLQSIDSDAPIVIANVTFNTAARTKLPFLSVGRVKQSFAHESASTTMVQLLESTTEGKFFRLKL
jgi:hypothetical protein